MRVLLDECLPRKLKLHIDAELVKTVPEAGWASKKNGELLRLAEKEFDVIVTNDQNIEHQQNLSSFDLAFIVLVAPTNDIVDLLPLMPTLNAKLGAVVSGTIEYVT
jgi:predicted nuclease of predicted toxin-antitoxin system